MRNQLPGAPIIFLLYCSIIFCAGCGELRTANLTSKLQRQIKQEEYERIYNESSLKLRRSIGEREFIDKLKSAVRVMKNADPELNWKNSPANFDSYGTAEGELKSYNVHRVLGQNEDVFVSMEFLEEKSGVGKLNFIRVHDLTTQPGSMISIP
ncbi:MAG TPA: hypothetical protein VIL74_05800 [Pyrinomonadaceae bacterium]|jgi:hypothetical protein